MTEDLIEVVQSELIPALAPRGFDVVESATAESFDNAYVVLQAPELRIRIVRERSQVFADFGPTSEPNTWFDSAVIIDHLGLSSEGGFHDRDVQGVLHGVASFVAACWSTLTAMFNEQRLAATKNELEALKEKRAAKLFGA
jgi:hypothetical protein